MARRAALSVAFLGAIAVRSSSAQSSPTTPDPATLRRSSFTWNQAEIEFGFGHWDAVFPTRPVPRGTRVRPLPAGKPLAALLSGTPGGEELERFIVNEKVTWLHRWALTRGVPGGVFAGEPDVPADIAAAADRTLRTAR